MGVKSKFSFQLMRETVCRSRATPVDSQRQVDSRSTSQPNAVLPYGSEHREG